MLYQVWITLLLGCDLFQIFIDILVVWNKFKVVPEEDYPKLKYHNKTYILFAIVKIVILLIAKSFIISIDVGS